MATDCYTEDQMLLKRKDETDKKKKREGKLIEKIEFLDEKKDRYTEKERKELEDAERSKAHFQKEIDNQQEKRRLAIEKAESDFLKNTKYFYDSLSKVELKTQSIQKHYAELRAKMVKKQEKIVNTISTPALKKEAELLTKKSDSETTSESTVESQSEPESESEEEAPPPSRPVKMTSKIVNSNPQQQPKIITNTKRPDPVIEQAKRDRELVSDLDKQLQDNNARQMRNKSLLKAERDKIRQDEDKIDELERERDFLKDERQNLLARVPKGFKTSIG